MPICSSLSSYRNTANQEKDFALVANIHRMYWDHVSGLFSDSSITADKSLRSPVSWRRMPWVIRKLENDSILGLRKGQLVPQMVISEDIRTRARRHNTGYLVPPRFSLSHPRRWSGQCAPSGHYQPGSHGTMLEVLVEVCAAEWGEYPEPVAIDQQNGEWLLRFRNHAGDANPSTIVVGGHRRLLVKGN